MIEVDKNAIGAMELPDFIDCVARHSKPPDTEEDLEKAFLVFNRVGDENVPINELETIMTKMGEPLTADQMKQLIAQANEDGDGAGSDASINYERFIKRMLSSYNK